MQWVPFPVYPAEQKHVGGESVELLRQLKQERDKQSLTTPPNLLGPWETLYKSGVRKLETTMTTGGICLKLLCISLQHHILKSRRPRSWHPGTGFTPCTVHLHHAHALLHGTTEMAGSRYHKIGDQIMDGEGSKTESSQPIRLFNSSAGAGKAERACKWLVDLLHE